MKKENLISKNEFHQVLELIHDSGLSKTKFAINAGINPAYLLRVINRGQMSRKVYDRIMAEAEGGEKCF